VGPESEHPMPIIRGETSRGLHVRATAELLLSFLEALPDAPTYRRVALRNCLAALLRAYPELEGATDLAQAIQEMDGVPQTDDP